LKSIIPPGELRSIDTPHKAESPQHNSSQNRAIRCVFVMLAFTLDTSMRTE
jgi:hypothetical protein